MKYPTKKYQKPCMETRKQSIEEIFGEAMQDAGFKPLKVGPTDLEETSGKYQLLSGEDIDLGDLAAHEWAYIESVKDCITACVNHDENDYFYVSAKALNPLLTGKGGKPLAKFINSPLYKIVRDMVTRYGHKCKLFGDGKNELEGK